MFSSFYNKIILYKAGIIYTSSSILRALTTMIVGFIIAKYISPQDLGIWTSLNLILTYSIFVQGGVINGLNLELPAAFGNDDHGKALRFAGVAQTFTILICVFSLIIIGIYLWIFPNSDMRIQLGLGGVALIVALTFYQNYLLSTFRSNSSFSKLSKIQLFETIFNICSLVLVVYYSYYGLVLKAILVLLFFVTFLHFNRPVRAPLIWNRSVFFELFKVGIPIFVLVLMDTFAGSIDKLLLLKYSDLSDVGVYAFGLYALTTFTLFSSSVASYIYPKMTFSYAKNNNKLLLWNYVKKLTVILFIVQLPIAIVGYFLIPIVLPYLFPNYISSEKVMQILLVAGVFKGAVIGVNVLWSLKKWKLMYAYQIIYSILLVGIVFCCLKIWTNKIEGVAYGVLIANFVNLFNGLYLSYLGTHEK